MNSLEVLADVAGDRSGDISDLSLQGFYQRDVLRVSKYQLFTVLCHCVNHSHLKYKTSYTDVEA